jgi:nicotinate-nucleotide adenylyltransferase
MKRIGILGGAFNPVHLGHLTAAQMVREQLKLDKVIFVPSNLAPHKKRKNVAATADRLAMVRLAIKDNPYFEVSDIEIKREGKSYSIETVAYFRDYFSPGTRLYFIIGSDLLPTLHTWKHMDDVQRIVSFVAVTRAGYREKESMVKVKLIAVPGPQTSSSDIRRRIMSGKTVKYLVPDNVLDYIDQKKLFKK